MGDLRDFIGTNVGHGIFIMRYELIQRVENSLSNNVTGETLFQQEWCSQLSVISQTWHPDFAPTNPEGEVRHETA